MKEQIISSIRASMAVKEAMLHDEHLLSAIEALAGAIVKTFRDGGKVLFCGNGGSAADAQHIAAELSGRFYRDRPALFAEALHVNSSFVTAVANDYGYDMVYARMVEAAGKPGDVLVAISTSGNSPNIIKAVEAATRAGMFVAGLTGSTGGKMKDICDLLIAVPSTDTPRIQEAHILVGHVVCEEVEKRMF